MRVELERRKVLVEYPTTCPPQKDMVRDRTPSVKGLSD